MATVVTSIGSNSSIDTETPSSCSGSYSPYAVTFATDPTGVSVGDRVEITDEGVYWSTFVYRVTAIVGSTYTLAYVTDDAFNGDASPCELVDGSFSQAPATFKRFYSSITNWEAGLDDSEVYASSDVAVGECHNDSVFNETVTINGGTSVGLASITLSVHSGSRHDGTAGTGARIVTSSTADVINVTRTKVTVEWLEIENTSTAVTTSQPALVKLQTNTSGNECYVQNMILHDFNISDVYSIRAIGTGTYNVIQNCFIYAINNSGTGDGRGINGDGTGLVVSNNTIFDVSTDGIRTCGHAQNGSALIRNNVVLSCGDECFVEACGVTVPASSDYNLSDDLTAFGSHAVTSADGATAANTITNTSSGSENLHLKAGSYAIEAGTDLGTTPTGVEIDIDGLNRDTDTRIFGWDIGADQTIPTGVTISPAAAAFELAGVSPSVIHGSLAITVAVAAFVLAGVNPTVSTGSVTASPTAAAFELAGITPTTVLGSQSITPAVAAFELAGVSPSIATGSVTASPAVAALEFAGVSPSVTTGSVTASPAAATFELAAVSPSVIVPEIITPAAASFELAGVSPTAVAGSLSVTPAVAAVEFAGVSPSVGMSSLTVAPAASAIEFAGVNPSVAISSQTITPTVAALEFAGISPTITLGSVSVTPAAAITNYRARYAAVIAGGIVVVPVTEAQFVYTAVDPAVGMSSQTVAVTASAFELAGVTPSTINGSISLTPAVSVVELAASVATIHAGIEVTPAVAAFEYVVGSFTLHVTMDSAALGYSCDGLVDYRGSIPCDYEIDGVLDYIGGVLPTDYQLEKNLDYSYDD